MINRLLLLGATGDLSGRFLLPALAELHAETAIPSSLHVVGTGPERWSDDEFRRHAAVRLEEHAKDVSAAARERLLGSLSYCRVELGAQDVAGQCARCGYRKVDLSAIRRVQ
jgi:glucose-6-phosphate 1-dehydrogenase